MSGNGGKRASTSIGKKLLHLAVMLGIIGMLVWGVRPGRPKAPTGGDVATSTQSGGEAGKTGAATATATSAANPEAAKPGETAQGRSDRDKSAPDEGTSQQAKVAAAEAGKPSPAQAASQAPAASPAMPSFQDARSLNEPATPAATGKETRDQGAAPVTGKPSLPSFRDARGLEAPAPAGTGNPTLAFRDTRPLDGGDSPTSGPTAGMAGSGPSFRDTRPVTAPSFRDERPVVSPSFRDARPVVPAPSFRDERPVAADAGKSATADAPSASRGTSATDAAPPTTTAPTATPASSAAAAPTTPTSSAEVSKPPAQPAAAAQVATSAQPPGPASTPAAPAAAPPAQSLPTIVAVAPPPLRVDAGSCVAPRVTTEPLDGGRMRLIVDAACRAGEAVQLSYGGAEMIRKLDGHGRLDMTLDAFAGAQSPLQLGFADASRQTIPILTRDLDRVSKIAVIWRAPVNLDLHVFEYAARYDQPGHLWAKAAASLERARSEMAGDTRGHGFLSTSDDETSLGDKVEVYTFLHSDEQTSGAISLALDYETRGEVPSGATCGQGALAEIDFQVSLLPRGGQQSRQAGVLTRVDCGQRIAREARLNQSALPGLRIRR